MIIYTQVHISKKSMNNSYWKIKRKDKYYFIKHLYKIIKNIKKYKEKQNLLINSIKKCKNYKKIKDNEYILIKILGNNNKIISKMIWKIIKFIKINKKIIKIKKIIKENKKLMDGKIIIKYHR